MGTAYIIDASRTPRGRGKKDKGALSGIHPQEILAQTLNDLAAKAKIDKADVDDVIVGCVTQAGERMPQKSTFFSPKVPTGMVFRVHQR